MHNLSKNLSIDDKTVTNYLISLYETGLINLIYPAEGGNQGLRRPENIFLNNTNLQFAIEGVIGASIDVGTIRELFFIQALSQSGHKVFNSKQGDYTVSINIRDIGFLLPLNE